MSDTSAEGELFECYTAVFESDSKRRGDAAPQ